MLGMSNVVTIGPVGRPSRAAPELGDARTQRALERIRAIGARAEAKAAQKGAETPTLTPVEEDFCQLAVSGYSLEAAAEASGLKATPGWGRYAHEYAKKAHIAARINALMEDRRDSLINEGERLRAFIKARLEEEASNAREGATRIRALEMLGKMADVGAFAERVKMDVTDASDPEDIKRLLQEKLKRMTGRG